ncbi:KRAB-A domain-containing protein 2-like [Onthophagus taurus]|uniref:KRAB-A domain-containing protein 2-like n=1 Tax=Onthophagus taurus TaxID=166361 RepID=UPI000C209037|nr:KRAB-A domain-containing protein 2-like [Onthophagus taurus]
MPNLEEPKIVHGKPRHSQSQGSVERANQDIEKMVFTWLETNKTTKWSEGLRFVQFMKNRAYHSGIERSSYEAMFGSKPKVGLKSVLPSFDGLPEIVSEEDLETMLKDADSGEGQNIILDRAHDNNSTDKNLAVITHSISVTIKPQPRSEPEQLSADTIMTNLSQKINNLLWTQ